MEQDQLSVEEGEISNDSDNTYIPLERPANYATVVPNPRFPVNMPQYDSEEEFQTSESDSDSDSQLKKNKRPKIKLKPKSCRQQDTKRKKYDIWNTRQEDVLAETLNSCDVTVKDRSRNVETYDFNLARQHFNNDKDTFGKIFIEKEHKQGFKRTRGDRSNLNYKQRRRSTSADKVKGKKRNILDLTVDLNSSAEEIAKDIGNKLYEEKQDLILKIVNILGKERALDIFEETKRIEEDGGMLIMNQTRRRTPGGVFLFLVRHDYNITQDQKNDIFEEERQKYKQESKRRQKEKSAKLKEDIAASKRKLLPDLLTRAELLASQNPARKVRDSDESDFINPPPTPETDAHENSIDGMDSIHPILNGNDTLDNARGKLNAFDEDFLDISCPADMDLF